MQIKKDDRRVRYTKMVLKESFVKLLEKKDISQIFIKEICEDADINRATFYAHYADQYDLMEKMQDELFENIETYLAAYTQNGISGISVSMVERIFKYIQENARLCRLLLGERGNLSFQKRVFMLVYEKNISELIKDRRIAKEDAEYIYAFMLTGCIGVIQRWLNDDMRKPPHFIAETIVKLTTGLPALMLK